MSTDHSSSSVTIDTAPASAEGCDAATFAGVPPALLIPNYAADMQRDVRRVSVLSLIHNSG